MDLTPPPARRPGLLAPALILGGVALTLALFGRADDEVTGRPRPGEALGLAASFALTASYIAALPALWRRAAGRSAALVMPGFVALVLGYLYLGLRTYFVQPGATGPALLIQLFLLVWLLCRAA